MSDVAIRVQGLGKRYRIGQTAGYKTLRDSLTSAVKAMHAGPNRLGVFTHRCKDGRLLQVEMTTLVFSEQGREQVLAIAQDLTQLRSMEERVARTERLADLGQLAAGLAHELRNPLNVIKTSVYYLVNAKSATPEKIADHLQRIGRQVDLAERSAKASRKTPQVRDDG